MKPIEIKGHLIAVEPLTVTVPGATKGFLPSYNKGHHYLPSSTLRHAIRIGALRAVYGILAAAGRPLAPEVALMLGEGFAPDNAKDAALTWDQEMDLRERNPFLSLFGLWRLPSRLSVGNAYAVDNEGSEGHKAVRHRAGPVRKLPSGEDIVAVTGMAAHLAKMEALAAQDRADKKSKADEKDAKGSVYSLANLADNWQEVVPGTYLDWRLTVFDSMESMALPFLVAGFRSMAEQPWLGGHRSAGCGRYGVKLARGAEGKIEIPEPGVLLVEGIFESALKRFDQVAATGFEGIDFTAPLSPQKAAGQAA